MTHETLVGLHVTDDARYQQYRDAMTPILTEHGGDFRYDFVVGKTLRSASSHPINRVFAIHFPDRQRRDAFFANADYLAARTRFFEPAVAGTTIIAEYERQ